MAKSKNHTAHNQSFKAHKNGIKKPKRHRQSSTKGANVEVIICPVSAFMHLCDVYGIDGPKVLEEPEVLQKGQQEER
ncbi:unnamed protein product [Urochloa humidicola]